MRHLLRLEIRTTRLLSPQLQLDLDTQLTNRGTLATDGADAARGVKSSRPFCEFVCRLRMTSVVVNVADV
jgi:hypothetical protein